ncbi:MAG: mannose-1-phosphate guanylyltransferase [Bacteroidales bacterium]|jgi:mannose-1-phosphate guanylyltransferase|nr:mannose-1-phosphate guanylyltransferase [Bacteroidales bacterium]
MNKNNYCIIMAGGVGARFWPMSKTARPKQFIDILDTGQTLIQTTFDRFRNICPTENIYIVTSEIYLDYVKNQLPEIADEQILGEPMRRNTAPCIAYASYKIFKKNPDANIVVAPSDHIISKINNFNDAILTALDASAKNDWLLTLGIQPTRPDTGYGYIQFEENSTNNNRISKVKTFTEKPQYDLAVSFLKSGDFLWNSGIFIWRLKSIMKAIEQYLPEIDEIFREGLDYYETPKENYFISRAYPVVKNISIDYGVMEKADNVYVISADLGWSDLGTWGSLYENMPKDESGNSIIGNNVMSYELKNCIVNMPKDKLVVLQGLEDYIVVESDNVLLVCHKKDEQEIRNFVEDIRTNKGEEFV